MNYHEALRELIDAKMENREPEYEEEAPQGKVVNLMDALKKSLGGKKAEATKEKAASKKPATKANIVSIPKPKAKKKAPTKTRRKAG